MKSRIHLRIFLPVLVAIVVLSLAAWLAFSATSGWYVRHIAEKKVEELITGVEKEAAGIYGSEAPVSGETTEDDRQKSRQLLSQVKNLVKNGRMEAKLIVLNSKMKQVYPGYGTSAGTNPEFYTICRDLLETGAISADTAAEFAVGDEKYTARLYEISSDSNIRAQYFIGYFQIPDTALLLSYTGQLFVAIAAVCLLLAGIVVWFTARSIAKPIETLCSQTEQIGNGTYRPIAEDYPVWELEKLKNAFNSMSRKLEDAEEQNTRFFQNVSHDLRTPLVSITGYAQGIQCGVMTDTKKAAEIILKESLRMTSLVESLLALSKMDNHALKLNPVSIHLEDFLEEQIEILQGLSADRELIFFETASPVTVTVDPDLMIRIFQNVISNCMRYAAHQVTVRLNENDGHAVITVEDDGPGISPAVLPHVFDRFYKGEDGNFGIGLSVVRSGLEYMGGDVEIKNKTAPDHGAVYQLRLPLLKDSVSPARENQ